MVEWDEVLDHGHGAGCPLDPSQAGSLEDHDATHHNIGALSDDSDDSDSGEAVDIGRNTVRRHSF